MRQGVKKVDRRGVNAMTGIVEIFGIVIYAVVGIAPRRNGVARNCEHNSVRAAEISPKMRFFAPHKGRIELRVPFGVGFHIAVHARADRKLFGFETVFPRRNGHDRVNPLVAIGEFNADLRAFIFRFVRVAFAAKRKITLGSVFCDGERGCVFVRADGNETGSDFYFIGSFFIIQAKHYRINLVSS